MDSTALTMTADTPTRIGYSREEPVPREVRQEWQRQLESIIPVSDQISHLRVRWEAGYPWQPIGRWIIWQCRPISKRVEKLVIDATGSGHTKEYQDELAISPEHYAALEGPHPMREGYACFDGHCPHGMDPNHKHVRRWVGGTAVPNVDLGAWELYHEVYNETGRKFFGKRWWVIQGDHGGHRYSLSNAEKRLATMAANWHQPGMPKIGELPYAPFDRRVLEHVYREDKVRRLAKSCADFALRTATDVQADLDAIQQEAADQHAKNLCAQVDLWFEHDAKPWLDYISANFSKPGDDARPSILDREEAITARFKATVSA